MSPDPFASAGGQPLPKPAPSSEPEESAEDLFDFDELSAASAKAAEARKQLDGALSGVAVAKADVARVVAAPPAPKAAAAPDKSATATDAPAPAAPPLAAGITVVHQKLSMSPLAATLLGLVVLANLVLMLFAWSSVAAVKQTVLDVAHEMRDTTGDLRSESSERSEIVARGSEPVFGALPEGYRTLEIARERVGRGEHERARRMLFGLLAVIDRVEPPARQEVEAQAGFLIADSFRIEAEALAPRPTEPVR